MLRKSCLTYSILSSLAESALIALSLHRHRLLTHLDLIFRTPHPTPPRPNPLVQTNSHRIHWINLPVKRRFEIPMRTQALLYKPASSPLGPKRQALEPLDIRR
jgi:hypothetical protein